ncbi:stannin isoform X3 [Macaca fascicularis]|uniref:stannin isoform X3 n=1 Tax=Macaca fascicularis TaxID=9541 RepID=UPI003D159506
MSPGWGQSGPQLRTTEQGASAEAARFPVPGPWTDAGGIDLTAFDLQANLASGEPPGWGTKRSQTSHSECRPHAQSYAERVPGLSSSSLTLGTDSRVQPEFQPH